MAPMFSTNFYSPLLQNPSFFELIAQEKLLTPLKPAVWYVIRILRRHHPHLESYLSHWKVHYLIFIGLLELYSLYFNQGSFAENFFDLKRHDDGIYVLEKLMPWKIWKKEVIPDDAVYAAFGGGGGGEDEGFSRSDASSSLKKIRAKINYLGGVGVGSDEGGGSGGLGVASSSGSGRGGGFTSSSTWDGGGSPQPPPISQAQRGGLGGSDEWVVDPIELLISLGGEGFRAGGGGGVGSRKVDPPTIESPSKELFAVLRGSRGGGSLPPNPPLEGCTYHHTSSSLSSEKTSFRGFIAIIFSSVYWLFLVLIRDAVASLLHMLSRGLGGGFGGIKGSQEGGVLEDELNTPHSPSFASAIVWFIRQLRGSFSRIFSRMVGGLDWSWGGGEETIFPLYLVETERRKEEALKASFKGRLGITKFVLCWVELTFGEFLREKMREMHLNYVQFAPEDSTRSLGGGGLGGFWWFTDSLVRAIRDGTPPQGTERWESNLLNDHHGNPTIEDEEEEGGFSAWVEDVEDASLVVDDAHMAYEAHPSSPQGGEDSSLLGLWSSSSSLLQANLGRLIVLLRASGNMFADRARFLLEMVEAKLYDEESPQYVKRSRKRAAPPSPHSPTPFDDVSALYRVYSNELTLIAEEGDNKPSPDPRNPSLTASSTPPHPTHASPPSLSHQTPPPSPPRNQNDSMQSQHTLWHPPPYQPSPPPSADVALQNAPHRPPTPPLQGRALASPPPWKILPLFSSSSLLRLSKLFNAYRLLFSRWLRRNLYFLRFFLLHLDHRLRRAYRKLRKPLSQRFYAVNSLFSAVSGCFFSFFWRKIYPLLFFLHELVRFLYKFLFLLDSQRWPFWSPYLQLFGVVYLRKPPQELAASVQPPKVRSLGGLLKLLRVIARVFFLSLVYCLRFVEWWYNSEERIYSKGNEGGFLLPPPPSPPPTTCESAKLEDFMEEDGNQLKTVQKGLDYLLAGGGGEALEDGNDVDTLVERGGSSSEPLLLPEDPRICAICHNPRDKPACIPSGYVFCYACLMTYLEEHGSCPITQIPIKDYQVIRLHEAGN